MPIRVLLTPVVSPVVDELQRDVEVRTLQQRDDGLQVVALLGRDADLVALDLGLDALGSLVADELGDLLGVLTIDTLLEASADLVGLARCLRLAGVEGLHGNVAAGELFLVDGKGGLCPATAG